MIKNILVTGAAGFIGANFVRFWRDSYPLDNIIALDLLTYAGNYSSIRSLENAKNFTFIKGDICDIKLIEACLIKHDINIVVHFAAESHVDRSISSPANFINTNIIGTFTLLEAVRKIWLSDPRKEYNRFHHVSTDEVYGELLPFEPAFTETTPYSPNSPYSASKAASDHLVRAYGKTYGLNVTTSNCSNNYGPFQFPEKLIPLTIANILLNKPIPIYGNGQQIRDWLYVLDHIQGLERAILNGQRGESYNFGSNNEMKNLDVVKLICTIMNERFIQCKSLAIEFPYAVEATRKRSESLIHYVDDRLGHDKRYAIDSSKSARELGYIATKTFETGLQRTVSWYLDNKKWWVPLLRKIDL